MWERSFAWAWVVVVVCVGCGGSATTPDGGGDMMTGPCTTDTTCDDGRYCNGDETCSPGSAAADSRGCLPGSPPCEIAMCDEAMDSCPAGCDDADADGHHAMSCGGDDCNDSDPDAYPGNTEVCDTSNHDEDCDPNTYGFRDSDGDAAPDQHCCNIDNATGAMNCGSDCDDMRPDRHPGLTEACDGVDNDCDGMTDEDVQRTFWEDVDGDGYGSSATGAPMMMGCTRPDHFAETHDDCRDDLLAVHPGAVEVCDATMPPLDEDCDGSANPPTLCDCTPPMTRPCALAGPCASGSEVCSAGHWLPCSIMPTAEVCDTVDNDCNGTVDDGLTVRCFADGDGDGYASPGATEQSVCPGAGGTCPSMFTSRNPSTTVNADCDDFAMGSHPGALDNTCDCIDQDCDGTADDGAPMAMRATYYLDGDGDGYGSSSDMAPVSLCACAAAGRSTNNMDCFDSGSIIYRSTAAMVHPGMMGFHSTSYMKPPCSFPCISGPQWDWDCNGVSEKIPNVPSPTCTDNPVYGCLGGGYTYTSAALCGENVTYHTCTRNSSGVCTLRTVRGGAPLECR